MCRGLLCCHTCCHLLLVNRMGVLFIISGFVQSATLSEVAIFMLTSESFVLLDCVFEISCGTIDGVSERAVYLLLVLEHGSIAVDTHAIERILIVQRHVLPLRQVFLASLGVGLGEFRVSFLEGFVLGT